MTLSTLSRHRHKIRLISCSLSRLTPSTRSVASSISHKQRQNAFALDADDSFDDADDDADDADEDDDDAVFDSSLSKSSSKAIYARRPERERKAERERESELEIKRMIKRRSEKIKGKPTAHCKRALEFREGKKKKSIET